MRFDLERITQVPDGRVLAVSRFHLRGRGSDIDTVLSLVAEGMPNKLIARRLEISEKTVKSHLTRIFERIGVTDRTQAALWAQRHGLGPDSRSPAN